MSVLRRETQEIGDFVVADPLAGYYNNLAPELARFSTEEEIHAHLDEQFEQRDTCNPVSILQIGIAAWQSSSISDKVHQRVAQWAIDELTSSPHPLAYHWDMPHTYLLKAPWQSSMAFGQALSLLARSLDQPHVQEALARAVECLEDPALARPTKDGVVYQEYPTTPESHVLNGWIWTLWGLHDAGLVLPDSAQKSKASELWLSGLETLEHRIELYEVGAGWSRYDLYPHRIRHWASPFYHRLHIAQLRATAMLANSSVLAAWADRFDAADQRVTTRLRAVAAKALFRGIMPRRRHAP